jgi:hypothetical protein
LPRELRTIDRKRSCRLVNSRFASASVSAATTFTQGMK